MKSNNRGFALVNILIVQVVIALVIGISWCFNLYKFTQCDFEAPYKAEILHGAGIVPIVSPFTVWFNGK